MDATLVIPRVSVILPLYHGLPHLLNMSESVLAWTYGDFELCLIDDGSTDGSSTVCDSFAARDEQVRHHGGVNRGAVASMNLGLAEARSPYVARLDADDMMSPTRLARQVAYPDAHPAVALVRSQVELAGPTCTIRWQTPTEPNLTRCRPLSETRSGVTAGRGIAQPGGEGGRAMRLGRSAQIDRHPPAARAPPRSLPPSYDDEPCGTPGMGLQRTRV